MLKTQCHLSKAVADYNRFENAFKTGGVTATTRPSQTTNGMLSHN
jgi:hypothetical protein